MTRPRDGEQPAGSPAALSCQGVVATPGDHPILRGVDLEVPGGSLTVLTGPSGVGKTTLLRTIAGLQPLDAGRIRLGGRDLTGVAPHRRRIAYVFQEPRLFPSMDVTDNVAFPLRMDGVGREERTARARALLDEVGLDHLVDRRPRGLSGGEAQRVALARSLSGRPDLLLLDEPLASVDPSRRQELRRLVSDLQARHRITTLYVTHDRTEAAELAERIAFVRDGRVVQHGPPGELFDRPRSAAVAAFFGSPNLLSGRVRDGRLELADTRVAVPGPDGHATFTIRPERVRIGYGELSLRVAETTYRGGHVRLRLGGPGIELTADVDVDDAPRSGQVVPVHLPAEHLWRLPGPDASGGGDDRATAEHVPAP